LRVTPPAHTAEHLQEQLLSVRGSDPRCRHRVPPEFLPGRLHRSGHLAAPVSVGPEFRERLAGSTQHPLPELDLGPLVAFLWEHDASYPCAPGDPPGRRVVVGAGRPAVRSDAHRDVDVRGVRVRPRVASPALRVERLRPDAAVENHVLDRAMIRLLQVLGELGEGQALIAEDIDRAHHTGAVRVVVRPSRGMRLVADRPHRRPRIHRPDLIPERLQGPREPPRCRHYEPSPCCSSASSRAVSASICACCCWRTGISAAVNRSYEIAAGRPSSSYCTKSPSPISSSSSAINPTCRMSSSGDSTTSPARQSPSLCCSCIQSGHCATCGRGSHDLGRICITAAGSISRSWMSRFTRRVEEIAVYVTCPVEVSMRSSAFPAPDIGDR